MSFKSGAGRYFWRKEVLCGAREPKKSLVSEKFFRPISLRKDVDYARAGYIAVRIGHTCLLCL